MQIDPHYFVLTDFGGLGLGHGSDPTTFLDAVDAYADHRDEGRDSVVFRIEPPMDGKAGMAFDVTKDADELIARRCMQRYGELPEWME